ncbi:MULTISPECIES: glycoside hydrolase family 27 protein [Nocardioides]|uniref:Alpha-galactosidase n=1 Tax=Nocardioides vastitatis TaxID=2568655 RepID=A0ABW0ZNT6_9ACTN|nr:ricin-type beta-trefoil lectin domain protein [Nocardioides sp.]THJ09201.1 hypothetical protein E7Z54_03440 [Nocardioides sp.]
MSQRLRSLLLRLIVLATALAGSAVVATVSPVAGAPRAAAAAPAAGIALTPPMGWNSWNTYFCDINEEKIRAAVDAIVSSGMRDAGYEYVVVDDCWQAPQRNADGDLEADPVRFPSGMKALGDYIHDRGLKFGIYQAPMRETCAQYFDSPRGEMGPLGQTGALGHEVLDAQRFASWGVDYLKYDWCDPSGTIEEQAERFALMGDALEATGRPIVYSINSNSAHSNTGPLYDWGQVAHLWRTTEDITDKWSSGCAPTSDCFLGVTEILDVQAGLGHQNGPGHWNDPDMLEVGVRGTFSPTENRAHFSMWGIMASPLMAGNNVTAMTSVVRDVLTNADVIEINQDPLGIQAERVRDDGDAEVWAKPLSDGSVAVALLNRGSAGRVMSTMPSEIGAPEASAYHLTDVWTKGVRNTTGEIRASVPGHGVVMYRVRPEEATATQFGLQGGASGRCIDAQGGIANNGTRAVIWDCNEGPTQIFSETSGQLMFGGQCLDVERQGTVDGSAVIAWECNNQTNQQWELNEDGTITAAQAGKCLTVVGGGTANNAALEVRTCTPDNQSQQWSKNPLSIPGPAPYEGSGATATISGGSAGWYSAESRLTVSGDAEDILQYRLGAGDWAEYVAPVALPHGTYDVSVRARDAQLRTSEVRTTSVKVDTAPPVVEVTREGRTVTIAGTDADSGVAGVEYRLDEGDWTTYTSPLVLDGASHTVAARASDVAGNTSSPTSLQVEEVSAPVSTSAPRVAGVPRVGRVLTASTGSWDRDGLTFTYQWLRDGRAIRGATTARYTLTGADLRSRVAIRVTATDADGATGTAVSRAMAPVRKAKTRLTAEATTIDRSGRDRVRVTVRASALGVVPAGRVVLRHGSKLLGTVRLVDGRARLVLRTPSAWRTITAVYPGSPTTTRAVTRVAIR